MSLNFTTRLVPEMTFTCRGTIQGVTAAGRPRQDRSEDPIIQIWRPTDRSNPISYYNTGSDIAISETVCAGTPNVTFLTNNDYGVWHCNLNHASQVSVEPRDIIGLLLPPRDQSSFYVSIVKASRGPTNYMIVGQQALSLSEVNLCDQIWTSSNQELPQIAIEVKSGIASYNTSTSKLTLADTIMHCKRVSVQGQSDQKTPGIDNLNCIKFPYK